MPINSFLYPGAKVTPAYEVANSVRFNQPDSAYLNRTLGTATNRKKFTFSLWFKRSSLTNNYGNLITGGTDGGTNIDEFTLHSSDKLSFQGYESSTQEFQLRTNQLFRDVSAWYHAVVAYDSTQGTASNRIKMYVNGTQVTSFAIETYPDENHEPLFNSNVSHLIGRYFEGSNYYNGYIAEVVFIDGSALAPTSFGEFDEDSPTIWKPIDVSGLTFGNNGFYLDFEDSANLGNDANGGTDWSETNLAATDQSTDTPTNNFCTLNPIFGIGRQDQLTYSEGNTVVVSGATSGSDTVSPSTFALNSGKWYAEFKLTDDADGVYVGVAESNFAFTNSGVDASGYANIWLVRGDDGTRRNNDNNAYVGSAFSDDEIISIAIDMDNSKIWWAVDGTYPNSGDPAAGSNAAFTNLSGELIIIVGDNYSSKTPTIKANFGNPSYANSSSAADANGYGDFEFAPPSGFYALCTKNLAEFG